jgi:hypothetical protein
MKSSRRKSPSVAGDGEILPATGLSRRAIVKKLILILCLIPSVAFSADLWMLTFKDGGPSQCGYFYAKGAEYCQRVALGEMCVSKADILKTKKVTACEETEPSASAVPDSLKKNQYVHIPKGGNATASDGNTDGVRDAKRKMDDYLSSMGKR